MLKIKDFTGFLSKKVKTKELADWFGVTYDWFRKKKKEKLEELKMFIEFEEVYGGIIIKKICNPIYDKDLSSALSYEILEEIEYCAKERNGLMSIDGIWRKKNEEYEYYQDNRVVTKYAVNKEFHKYLGTFLEENKISYPGEIGSYERVWAIKIDDYNNYTFMNKEQKQYFQTLYYDFAGINCDIVIDNIHNYKEGDSSAEECMENLKEYEKTFKKAVLEPFYEKYGFWVVRISKAYVNFKKIDDYKSMYPNKENLSESIKRGSKANQALFQQ